MTEEKKGVLAINQIPTGVPNLDAVLGGGIPEQSLTIIAGPAGVGKTTLAEQIVFHNATEARPALYFATLGEPAAKLMRYQQRFSFFDAKKVGTAVRFIDLSTVAMERGIDGSLDEMAARVKQYNPGIIVIDSWRAIEDLAAGRHHKRVFAHDLSMLLSAWDCTGFLIGEYAEAEVGLGPEFTVADNALFLSQDTHENATVRRVRVIKMRGQAPLPGRHSFRIDENGLQIYPRIPEMIEPPRRGYAGRAKFGVAGLDDMMHGGVPRGQTCIIAGSAGTGKTLLSLHFAIAGAAQGESCVMATFEESPAEHAEKMAGFGWNLDELERRKLVAMVYLRPVDLTLDEVMARLNEAVERLKAKRVVINSISGLQTALPRVERADLRDGLYRLLASLTSRGVTVLLTTEVPDMFGQVRLSEEGISFLADNAILLRYVEIASELRRVLMVLKMRTSAHDNQMREYRIGRKGFVVEQSFSQYSGLLSGIPTLQTLLGPQPFTAGLGESEEALMQTLLALPQASVEDLSEALGIEPTDLEHVLDKLTETGYVVRTSKAGKSLYRVALVTPGTRPPESK